METADVAVAQESYEAFIQELSRRIASINYDAEYDLLYIAGDTAWSPTMGEKPRTLTVASGTHIDVLRSTRRVFGVEIADFGKQLRHHPDETLIAWWQDLVDRHVTQADGQTLARAMRHASYV